MFTRYRAALEWLATMAMLAAGLGVMLRPLVRNGLGHAPGDLGDGRFIHFLLEHSWQWVTRNPRHPLWDPPFYFPVEGVGAYSDLMAGAGPLYWIWRLVGMGPGGSYNAWLLSIAALNVTAGFLFLWRCLRFSPLAAASGAGFLSAAAPLLNQSNHPQMLPQFYVMGVLAGLVMLVRSACEPVPMNRRALWAGFAATCFVLQMYTGFYYAWFLVLGCGIAVAWALVLPRTRTVILNALQLNWKPLLASGVLAGMALIPWAVHYVNAASLNDPITYEQMSGWIPRWESWFYLGPNSAAYQWMADWGQFAAIPDGTNHEHRLGVGLVTLALVTLGYLLNRRHPWVWISALVALTLVLMTTIVPGGVTAWRLFFEILPGSTAVRTLTRVALVVLIPLAIGIAMLVERLRQGRTILVIPLVMVIILAEQVIDYPTYSIHDGIERSAVVAREVPEGCGAFLYSPDHRNSRTPVPPTYVVQLDAMWAGILSDTSTVNAYGHIVPPGWGFGEPAIFSPEDESRLKALLTWWETTYPEAAPLCHVVVTSITE